MKEKRKGNLSWSDNMANLMDYVCTSNTYLTPQWLPLVEQEQLIVPEDLSYPGFLCGVRVTQSSVFCAVFCRSLFVLLFVAILLSVVFYFLAILLSVVFYFLAILLSVVFYFFAILLSVVFYFLAILLSVVFYFLAILLSVVFFFFAILLSVVFYTLVFSNVSYLKFSNKIYLQYIYIYIIYV